MSFHKSGTLKLAKAGQSLLKLVVGCSGPQRGLEYSNPSTAVVPAQNKMLASSRESLIAIIYQSLQLAS